MIKIGGWINIILIMVMASIYPIKQMYMKKYKLEGKESAIGLSKLYNFSRKAHPILGIIILFIGTIHGSMAYSLTVIHTGTILLYSIYLTGIIALIGQKFKPFKKHWRLAHRVLGLLVIVLAVIHVFWRNII